jgi:quercetin dioxygenase-like cupin family protein
MKKYLIFTAIFLISFNSFSQNNTIRKNLGTSNIATQCFSNIETVEIEFKEGFKAPKHKHTCTVIGYIISGECLFQIEGEKAIVLKKGTAFIEPADKAIIQFGNNSNTKKLKFVVSYLNNNEAELTHILK